jgi:hypothetical protein
MAWVEKALQPVPTDRHSSATSGNFLYTMGGEAFNGSYFVTSTVQRYDTAANTWQFMAPMPTAFNNNEACAMGGKIYVPGGYTGSGPPFSNAFYIYDIAGNSWTSGPNVPGVGFLWSTVVCDPTGNKVYAIGGYNGSAGVNNTNIYNVATNTWSSGAALPTTTYGSDGGLSGGNIYVTGGSMVGTYAYNIAANTWTPRATGIVSCYYGSSGVDSAGNLWVAGGGFCSNAASPSGRTERYDPGTNTWATQDPLNEAVYHTNGGILNGFMYTVAGFSGAAILPNTQQLALPNQGTPTATSTPCAVTSFYPEVEPNNTITNAQMLATANNVELRGAINPAGEVDYYGFAATSGQRVWAYAYTLGAVNSTDSQMYLANALSQTLQFDDDNGSQGSLGSDIAGAPITTTGSFYLELNDFGNNGTINPYSLFVDLTSGAAVPEVEPNDTITTANALTVGSVMTGTIPTTGDADLYSFAAGATDRVVIQVDGNPERDGVALLVIVGVAVSVGPTVGVAQGAPIVRQTCRL